MTSNRKIEAKRQNAKNSTGPTTTNGIALSKMNALKDGAYAKTRVLPFEDSKAYEDIAREIFDEFRPEGFLEITLTDQIIKDYVGLQRLERSEHAHLVGRATFFAQERVVQKKGFSELDDGFGFGFGKSALEQRMFEAKGTKLRREDIESALASSVGKNEGDLYERVDRRRRALMRDIVAKHREIEYLREKQLTLIQPVNDV